MIPGLGEMRVESLWAKFCGSGGWGWVEKDRCLKALRLAR